RCTCLQHWLLPPQARVVHFQKKDFKRPCRATDARGADHDRGPGVGWGRRAAQGCLGRNLAGKRGRQVQSSRGPPTRENPRPVVSRGAGPAQISKQAFTVSRRLSRAPSSGGEAIVQWPRTSISGLSRGGSTSGCTPGCVFPTSMQRTSRIRSEHHRGDAWILIAFIVVLGLIFVVAAWVW